MSPWNRHFSRKQLRRTPVRVGLDLLNLAVICLVVALSTSCATKQEFVRSSGKIFLPETPARVEIEPTDQIKIPLPGVTYIKSPLQLKPSQVWRAFEDGALAWRPRDWRGVNHLLTEWPKWGDTVKQIVSQHNQEIEGKKDDSKSKWYKPWSK